MTPKNKKRLLIAGCLGVLALGSWWITGHERTLPKRCLAFSIGPVFYSNGVAMCSVTVSNTSNFHLLIPGNIKTKSEKNIGVAFFANGVRLSVHPSSRDHDDSSSTLSPHKAISGEIRILPGSDSLQFYDSYEVLIWKRRIFLKLVDSGHFEVIEPLKSLFGEYFFLQGLNSIRTETSDIFLLPLK